MGKAVVEILENRNRLTVVDSKTSATSPYSAGEKKVKQDDKVACQDVTASLRRSMLIGFSVVTVPKSSS